MPQIAFNTANLVARTTGYKFSLSNWMDQHEKTVAATDAREFNTLCSEIRDAGFSAIELWQAHADPKNFTPAKGKIWREILDSHDLTPIAYGGGLSRETAEICSWIGIPLIAGGGHPTDLDEARALCKEFGVRYGFENHPEKSSAAILSHIGGASDAYLGVAVDTGWLGTQGLDAPAIIRELGEAVFHVHLKDVAASGGHETVPLGQGVVNIEGVISALREIGYAGNYSWEDEPEDRDPFAIAAQMREWIEARI